ncbi:MULTISPECIES: type II toxin-antitoxin system RelE/ParE family toxin [Lactonifactor]|uniref:type II toxin-antitoxin system RelE/ParE family toxin n=1 Tax=Lactonifactor TaxID=420345 RepID=UPI0012AFDCB3|nr:MULTISPECIES: type II toxin-antitoxin system RelE/ParE family toxin [Lactonifactor]MCB5714497.1 type II toxin-antitoxin system RelE/ParE family toxin [Lactonifactor longoviformis]MCB5718451.1 type II toxin-antitoxin system RelE/ParE family toxin [Lactonifactor longoviformis]MSA01637.1 type II toxin-antitoxin system RelE/ParE family toxin [Lactonifactor sp. BIOML-A5]MSA08635.1 type II toxin-antitoxin system RelE/ParE family toxin [Lactonifactor sp. BIOML-A4]MSA13969.1 type II toxin-antitoxin
MIYHIALTEQADSDLRGIYEYIAFSLVEPENAAGQLDRLKENILKLADMPGKFKLYEKEPYIDVQLRNTTI